MKKSIPVHEIFESRRSFPRLRIDSPAFVENSEGVRIKAYLYDLSPDGAQIRYNKQDAESLLHSDTPISNIKSMQFRLKFELTVNEHREAITILCRPVYLRSINEDLYAAGVVFDKGYEKELTIINDYLIYEMDPVLDGYKSFVEKQTRRRSVPGDPGAAVAEKKNELKIRKNQAEPASLDIDRKANIGTAMENLKQEVIRLRSGMKALEQSNCLILEKLNRIEKKL